MSIKKHLATIKKDLHQYAEIRRDIIKHAGDARHHSKRAIFSLHAGNIKEAKKKLSDAKKIFIALNKKYKKEPRIKVEGAYREGLEEYVEGMLFYQFILDEKIDEIKGLPIEYSVYLAGLCDLPGELYRYAIKAATEGDTAMVERCAALAKSIIG